MAADYIPESFQNLRDWAQQFSDEAPTTLAGLGGWDVARITTLTDRTDDLATKANAVLAAQDALDQAIGALNQARSQQLSEIRSEVRNIKSSTGYNQGIGQSLEILSTGDTPPDPQTYKPEISASTGPGGVRLMVVKRGVDSANIYSRLQGETPWKLLAAKRVRFPFEDDSPLAQPGVPETREYRAIGVEVDTEIGQPSDIVSILYGG